VDFRHTVRVNREKFIVLTLGDSESWGYNEHRAAEPQPKERRREMDRKIRDGKIGRKIPFFHFSVSNFAV